MSLAWPALTFADDGKTQKTPARDPYPGLTAAQKERLKQRDVLDKRCQALAKEGKYPEAIEAAEAMLAIECEVLGRVHRDVAASLYAIARLHTGVGQYAAALKASTELVEVKPLCSAPSTGRWPTRGTCEITSSTRRSSMPASCAGLERRRRMKAESRPASSDRDARPRPRTSSGRSWRFTAAHRPTKLPVHPEPDRSWGLTLQWQGEQNRCRALVSRGR